MQTPVDPQAPSAAPREAAARAARFGRALELVLLLGGTLGVSLWSVHSGGAPAVVAALLGVMPAVLALQHGLIAGVVGVVFAALSVSFATTREALPLLAPMLAPFALALAVGYFTDRSRGERRALHERAAEQARQLEQLFRTYDVLRSSHVQLEARMAAREWSLDAAVREAGRKVAARDLAGAAAALLELLAAQGRVSSAALYMARSGMLPVQPDAYLGASVPSSRVPRELELALGRGTMVALERERAATGDGEVLLAFPLITTGGRSVDVVAVYELPSVAFHEAHFRLLSTLIAPFTDALARKLGCSSGPAHGALPPPLRALARLPGVMGMLPPPVGESLASPSAQGPIEAPADAPHVDDVSSDAAASSADSPDDDETTQHRVGSPRLVRL